MQKNSRLLLFILFLIFFAQGCGEEPPSYSEQKAPAHDGIIVAVGDSLTEGLGVEEEFAYPAKLEEKLQLLGYNYRVINAGISGETSSATLSRIDWVLTLKPDIVILVIGANDGFRGITPELIKSNIIQIIRKLKENNVVVVLGGMQMVQNMGVDYTAAFEKIYPAVARSENIILIPFFLSSVAAHPELNQADGIHPTKEGYQVIVNNITPFVLEALKAMQTGTN
jgi:acyl-CoA thioesterase-1